MHWPLKLIALILVFKNRCMADETNEATEPVAEESQQTSDSDSSSTNFDLGIFNRYDDIREYMGKLTRYHCPTGYECRNYKMGTSFENRSMIMAHIYKPDNENRKIIWINGALHGFEWLTTTTILKIFEDFINQRSENAQRLLSVYDFMFAPVLNPDGYEFAHTTDRLCYNNRHPINASCAGGVNLDSNFDFRWGYGSVSHDPCGYNYCGSSPASEPEVLAIKTVLSTYGRRTIAFIDLAEFGRHWKFPFANKVNYTSDASDQGTCERTDDYQDLMDVANAAANAAQATFNTNWTRGTTCDSPSLYLKHSGNLIDFVKAVTKVKYPFQVYVRGGYFRYNITSDEPPSYNVTTADIQPNYSEVWNGLVAMCDAISAKSS